MANTGGVEGAHDYCRLRNHLIMRVCISNRQRAGAISNMSVEGLLKAKIVSADDGTLVHTVTVGPHKTADVHGPVTLGFEGDLYTLLCRYIQNVRSQHGASHVEPERGPLWLTLHGNKVSAKRISHCIQKAWRLTGSPRPVTTTILRKTAVSKGFEHDPSVMPQLGRHMTHTPAVQEKYYLVSKKRRNTANMAIAIKRAAMPSESPETRMCVASTSREGSPERASRVIQRIAEEIKPAKI